MQIRFLLLLTLASVFCSSGNAADFAIHDGDRVVFLGDSITEQRLYTTYVEAYALSRYPAWNLTFRNVGWGGDTSWLRQRAHPDEARLFAAEGTALDQMVQDSVARGLSRDVLPLKPTFVTVKFGMNDHSYQTFRPDIFRAYIRSQSEISQVLQSHQARVTFLTPQPIEDRRADPDKDVRNESLRKFSDGLKDIAAKTGAGFVDQFDPYMGIMLAERARDPKAFIGGGDAIHPGPAGQTLMAWVILKGLGASSLVSSATIDAGSRSVSASQCRIEKVESANGTISFDRVDDTLPWPVDKAAEPALKLAPVLDDLSWYDLKITGLPEGSYVVTIDGENVATLTATDLRKGWNLSNSAGPITQQARDLLAHIFEKNNLYFNRWRNVQLAGFPTWATGPELEARRDAELKRLDERIAQHEQEINELRKPKRHHFEVKPSR